MKRMILAIIICLFGFTFINAQKLDKPKHLGDWVAGEDPSEFLLHLVMEYSQALLKENSNGKLMVRICSSDNLETAFVKTSINPLSASNYNKYYLIVPYENIFIANYSGCVRKDKFVYNQYWFVPKNSILKYDEIVSVNKIKYINDYYVEEYDYQSSDSKRKNYILLKREFEKIRQKFINTLISNPNSKGFMIHNSKRKNLKRNIENIIKVLQKNGIEEERFEVVKRPKFEWNNKGKIYLEENDELDFPRLAVLEINK